MAGFADEIAQWSDRTRAKVELAVRKIALDVFTNVILMSPVDTGRFRGNWSVAIGTMPTGTIELSESEGGDSVGVAGPVARARISAVQAETLGLKAGQTIFLVNNLPYAQALEYGSSKQAPGGMVRLTAQRFQPIVDAVSRELSKG